MPPVRGTAGDVRSLAPTLALPSEKPTVAAEAPAEPAAAGSGSPPRPLQFGTTADGRLAGALAVAAAAAAAMLLFSGERGAAGPPAPNVVALPAKSHGRRSCTWSRVRPCRQPPLTAPGSPPAG